MVSFLANNTLTHFQYVSGSIIINVTTDKCQLLLKPYFWHFRPLVRAEYTDMFKRFSWVFEYLPVCWKIYNLCIPEPSSESEPPTENKRKHNTIIGSGAECAKLISVEGDNHCCHRPSSNLETKILAANCSTHTTDRKINFNRLIGAIDDKDEKVK